MEVGVRAVLFYTFGSQEEENEDAGAVGGGV